MEINEATVTINKRIDLEKGYQAYKDCFFEATISGEVNGVQIQERVTVQNRFFNETDILATLQERYILKKKAAIAYNGGNQK